MASSPVTSWQIEGEKVEAGTDFLFLGSKIPADGDCSREIRWLLLGRKATTILDSAEKPITLLTKVHAVKAQCSQCHVWLWELDRKEGRSPKTWCLQIVVLEETPDSRLGCREINREYSLEGLMLKQQLQYFGHLMWTADSLEKIPDAGKDWRQKKRVSENEMAGWHHPCNGHELGQTLGDGEGHGDLACCSPWGHKESDMTG